MKKKRTNRKPKLQRDSLNKRIAAAAPQDRIRVAISSREKQLKGIAGLVARLVADWDYLHELQRKLSVWDNAEPVKPDDARTAALRKDCRTAWTVAQTFAHNFIEHVMHGSHADMLEELAREMKRTRIPRNRKSVERRFVLLKASESGVVDYAAEARKLADQEFAFAEKHGTLSAKELENLKIEKAKNIERDLRRIGPSIGVKTRAAGRPKQSDT